MFQSFIPSTCSNRSEAMFQSSVCHFSIFHIICFNHPKYPVLVLHMPCSNLLVCHLPWFQSLMCHVKIYSRFKSTICVILFAIWQISYTMFLSCIGYTVFYVPFSMSRQPYWIRTMWRQMENTLQVSAPGFLLRLKGPKREIFDGVFLHISGLTRP
jgi:hypothetical protein